MADDEDPFGMGAPPLAEPAGDSMGDDFGAAPAMPESNGFDMGSLGEAPPLAEPEPASESMFGDMAAPPPEMPPMDMGGMGGGNGMGAEFVSPPGGEVGPVAKWRLENAEKVAAKQEAARAAEAAKIAEAQAALQQFYAERTAKVSARATQNRSEEAQYVQDRDAAMIADSWDSVCKLVDLKEKANQEVDTNRMRSLLIQLKN